MKAGRDIVELAKELKRQAESKRDFVAPTSMLEMAVFKDADAVDSNAPNHVFLQGLPIGPIQLTEYAHGQIAQEISIPKKYYDRMWQDAPELLASNVNHWFKAEPQKRLIRTLDGRGRAVLSDKYRPLDNIDLADVSIPVLQERGCQVVSAEITDRRLYIKATLDTMNRTLARVGDMVQAGVVISNSEVGAGAVRVEPLIYTLRCLNGMIVADSTMRRYHIGRNADVEGVRELLTTETRKADDRAFWMTVRDVVAGAFDKDVFNMVVDKLEIASGDRIEGDVPDAIIEVTDKFSLGEGVSSGILRHLIEGGDLTRYGLLNAVTRTAEDQEDYEVATELERVGGKILELAPGEWRTIAGKKAA